MDVNELQDNKLSYSWTAHDLHVHVSYMYRTCEPECSHNMQGRVCASLASDWDLGTRL